MTFRGGWSKISQISMKKGKLLAKDGSEFTVFYHKPTNDPKQPLEGQALVDAQEKAVEELNCHLGGWPPAKPQPTTCNVQMEGTYPYQKGEYPKWKKDFFKNKKEFLDKLMVDIKLQHPTAVLDDTLEDGCQLSIDDSIDSDKINEPEVGQLYKVKYLNKIARFVCHSQVEGVHTKRYYNMRHHGHEFHVPTDYLLKANDLEVNKYLGK